MRANVMRYMTYLRMDERMLLRGSREATGEKPA